MREVLATSTPTGEVVLYTVHSPQNEGSVTPDYTKQATELVYIHASGVIREEARQLGIEYNREEVNLWPLNVENSLESLWMGIFIPLSSSQNPHFRDVKNELQKGFSAKDFNLQIHQEPLTRDAEMQIHTHLDDDGQIRHTLDVSTRSLFDSPNPCNDALNVTHESVHLRRHREFLDSLPTSLSNQEKMRLLSEAVSDIDREEAYAEAKAAEALIVQLGFGVDEHVFDVIKLICAVKYIETGKNPENKEWKEFIKGIQGR